MLADLLLRGAKPLAVVALIAGLVMYRAVLVKERDAAEARVKVLEEDKAAALQANAAMEQAVARQNQAIVTLNNEAVSRLRAAQTHEGEADRQGAAALKGALADAVKVSHAVVPEDCSGAIAWGNAQGPELGRW